MKKIIILISLLSFSLLLFSQSKPLKWYSLEEAQKLNTQTPKKILIDVYTDWCGWCKRMDQTTFNNPAIAKYLNDKYYPVKFNAESRDSIVFNGTTFKNNGMGSRPTHDLAIALLQGKMSYPSIAYLNEKLQLLGAIPGYKTPQQMEPIIVFIAEEIYKTETLDNYMASFESKLFKESTVKPSN